MRHKTRQLRHLGLESLILAVEVFNRPSPVARTSGVLLNLQHALEMLFKAAIYEERQTITPKRGKISYSFNECVCILRDGLNLLSHEQALVATIVDAHRDAVQHYGSTLTEHSLYVDVQSGLTLVDAFLGQVFGQNLGDESAFAGRTLPVCTNPPREFHVLATSDFEHIADLLNPKHHRHAEALALLRPHVLTDRVVVCDGEVIQPSEGDLARVATRLAAGEEWQSVVPGLARLGFDIDESAVYGLRITKEADAMPVRLVKPDDPDASGAAAVLEIDSLNQFPFYTKDIASQAGVNAHSALSLIHLLDLQNDAKCFREFMLGKQVHKRYSHRALQVVRQAIAAGRLDEAREFERQRRREARASKAA